MKKDKLETVDYTQPAVLLPIIRRVMPTIIANDILGVRPMAPSNGLVFSTRYNLTGTPNGWGGRVVFTKDHYRHFTRVYDRRKQHYPGYLDGLGYTRIRCTKPYGIANDAELWCQANLKPGSWVRSYADFWFAHESDATMFKLVWV